MRKDKEEEVADFKEEEAEPMEKVADLIKQYKTRIKQNGNKNLLVKELITLEVAILVTLEMVIMVREKRCLGLRELVSSVEKDIDPLNVIILVRRLELATKMLQYVKKVVESPNKPKNGENLMSRRITWNEETSEKPILSKKSFKTKRKIAHKCCKVIIDSGILDNLGSEELVKKLQLYRLIHPKPYHIAWVQKERKLLVSEQCLVKFKTRNYSVKVLCDIMPMTFCHIFLDIPWQYDRQALHDGRLNQYTIWVDGKKQVLFPLIEKPNENHCTIVRVCLVEGNQFIKDVKELNFCFALISRNDEKKRTCACT